MKTANLEMSYGYQELIANYGLVAEGEADGVGEVVGAGVYEGSGTKVELGIGSVVGPMPHSACIPVNSIPV